MKLTLQDHIDDFRAAIGDNNYSEDDIIRYINKAQMDLARKLDIQIPYKATKSQVAYQEEYSLPSNIRRVEHIRCGGYTLDYITKKELEQFPYGFRNQSNTPYLYWIYGNSFGLYYIPGSNAETTQTLTTFPQTATSIKVDYNASFPARGTFIIEDEVISYTHITTASDNSYMILEGLERGIEGTVAVSYPTISNTITLRDIEIFGYVRPSKFLNAPNSGSLSENVSGSVDAGLHYYQVTYYSSSLQMESMPYALGPITVTSGGTVEISDLPISNDNDVDYKRIYRTLANGNIYYYVTQIANTTITFDDTLSDSVVSGYSLFEYPYSQIPEDYHEILTWMALKRYFEDNEEMSRAMYWDNMVQRELPEAIWEEHQKIHPRYGTLPLPE